MVKHVELTQQISQIPTRNALGSQTMGILILIGTVSQFEEEGCGTTYLHAIQVIRIILK